MDTFEPVGLLEDLIRIDSSNPDLVPDGAGETAIADHCSAWLTDRGFTVHRLERRAGRPSIVAVRKGAGGGRTLMLNGHLDTVGLAHFDGEPLIPVLEEGRLYGRGTYDMKAGVAAIMSAAAHAAPGSLRGDLIVALVADEEHASFGTEEVLESFTADGAIVCEPTNLDVVVAHRGFVWFDVRIVGRAAHGSRADLGIDAIAKAGHFLTALDDHAHELLDRTPHPLLGTATIHASLISGGQEASTYPAECRITVERRTLPGESTADLETELRTILDRIESEVGDFEYELRPSITRPPMQTDTSSDIYRILSRQAEARLGHAPTVRGEAFWTDAAFLERAGIPSLLFGVAGEGAHAAVEYVELGSLHRMTDVLTATIEDFCS